MANPAVTPEIICATVGLTVSALTPSFKAGTALIKLLSRSTSSVWIRFDGTDPVASFGSGRFELQPGDSISLNLEEISIIEAISDAAAAGFLQVIFYPSDGHGMVQ